MKKEFIAFDIETTGLDYLSDKILCVGFSDGRYYTHSFDQIHFNSDPNRILVSHNGSFDTKFLWSHGVDASIENEFDTMIAAYLLKDRPTSLSLDSLVSYYLGLPSWKEDIKSGAIFEDKELLREYCLQDCLYTEQLAEILYAKLEEEGRLEFFWQLMKVRRMLTRAEYRGIRFDVEKAKALTLNLNKEADDLLKSIQIEASDITEIWKKANGKKSFNFMSPKQILWFLKHLGLETINPVTKKESADVTVLTMNKGKNPVIDQLLKLRKLKKKAKSIEGYLEDVKSDGKIHCNFNCSNVRTGRLSSSGPNLQQVDGGSDVRELFTTDDGSSLVIGDMAQIEVRMAAHYSRDPVLMAMFERAEDFYGTIAVEVLNSAFLPNEVKEKDPVKRKVAKVIGLSILYGVGPNKLKTFIKEKGGVDFSHTEIRHIINRYFERFSGLKGLQMGVHKTCESRGALINLYKRHIDIGKADIFMKGVNSLLQSSASDLLLFKQLEVEEKAPWAKLLLTVHDEVVYNVPKGRENEFITIIKSIMEDSSSIGFRVPLKFDVIYGENWSCKK